MLGASGPSGTTFTRLSDVGMEIQRDGTLSLNSTKLETALKSTSDLNTFFTASTGSSATDGMARRINSFIQQANGVDGNVSGRSSVLQASIARNTKDQDALNVRLTQRQTALYKPVSYTHLSSMLVSSCPVMVRLPQRPSFLMILTSLSSSVALVNGLTM